MRNRSIDDILWWVSRLLILGFILIASVEFIRPKPWSPAIQHYEVPPTTTSSFQLLWQQNDIFGGTGRSNALVLTATGERVFLFGGAGPYSPNKSILRLNLLTGEVESSLAVRRVDTIASDENFLYVGTGSAGNILPDMLEGAARVTAYEIASGRQVWSQRIRGSRWIVYIAPYENLLSVNAAYSNTPFNLLDKRTGRVTYSSDIERPFFYIGNNWYISQRYSFKAVNSQSNILWEQQVAFPVIPPVLHLGVILGWTGRGELVALDPATGAFLWRSNERVYDNFAVSNGIIYYLTEQAELRAVNVQTGQVVAALQFKPETPQEGLTQQRLYNVAASGDIVVVYLGDSRQLFAFRFNQ